MALSRLSSTATRLKSITHPTPSLNVCRGALSTTDSITIDINVPFTAHRFDPPPQQKPSCSHSSETWRRRGAWRSRPIHSTKPN
ncbi:unnamed protein product [Rhodiola kirilowii]